MFFCHVAFSLVILGVSIVSGTPFHNTDGPGRLDSSHQQSFSSFCSSPGWRQEWADEFDAPSLNTSTWSIDFGGGDSRVRSSTGTAENVYLENGHLVLRSQRQTLGNYSYTSAAVDSQNKASFSGPARVCVSAVLPGGAKGSGAGAKIPSFLFLFFEA